MFKLKRILPVLLVIAILALSAVSVEAAPPTYGRYGSQKSTAVQTSTALLLPAGTWVYGLEIFADSASSVMGIYDSATLEGAIDATVVDEIGEATQFDTVTKFYPRPILFENGVTVVIGTGISWVYFGPQPSGAR